jgi:hypothetical protein
MTAVRRLALIVLCASSLLWGCADDQLSMTEYVEQLQALVDDTWEQAQQLYASPQGAVLDASGPDLAAFTPQDLKLGLGQLGEIEAEFLEKARGLEPPSSIADFHRDFLSDRFTNVREALAERAGDATSWAELSASGAMAEYRTTVADDKRLCLALQADLHERAERGVFADTPWVPDEVEQIFDSVLGCDAFPEHPEDMWRP